MEKKYVAYYRVSTKQQGISGLGLDAQRETVQRFVKCNECIIAEYQDVESGKTDDRPHLQEAITHASLSGATLVIAKLDRLSRDVAFIFNLKKTGVDFVACDLPVFNTMTLGVFATMAQHERELISIRTKDALAAKRRRGETVGNPSNFNNEGRRKGAEAMKRKALTSQPQQAATSEAQALREKGYTLQAIADVFNAKHYQTPQGKMWKAGSVHSLLNRAK